jgi:hypothetical protein
LFIHEYSKVRELGARYKKSGLRSKVVSTETRQSQV